MKLEELKEYFGTWTALCYDLRIATNHYQYWRKRGYIPYETQLKIEERIGGALKAKLEDGEPGGKKYGVRTTLKDGERPERLHPKGTPRARAQ